MKVCIMILYTAQHCQLAVHLKRVQHISSTRLRLGRRNRMTFLQKPKSEFYPIRAQVRTYVLYIRKLSEEKSEYYPNRIYIEN